MINWPQEVKIVSIPSSADGSAQPAAFYDSGTPGPKPLLVALHTWSYDYDQEMNIPYAEWCIAHDWILIAPSFRGPNNCPEAAGSELAVQDVLDAVDYACQRALSLSKRGPSTGSGCGPRALSLSKRGPWIGSGREPRALSLSKRGPWIGSGREPRALSLSKRGPSTGSGRVDARRIYLAGVSGGGHMALLMAGRAPDRWAAVSAWVPISDLAAWHAECRAAGRPYAADLERSCGGAPGDSLAVDAEYRARSPLTYLNPDITTPLDINAGILDGHTGSVPISHTLRAFNAVAAAEDRIGDDEIAHFVEQAAVPPGLCGNFHDPLYGDKRVLFRRQSNNARVTIFDGGHEIIYEAALNWLAGNIKRIA